jgi:hypothetical protein
MNWNGAEFSIASPITLLFSERVGEVMASLSEDAPVRHEYLFCSASNVGVFGMRFISGVIASEREYFPVLF